MQTSELTVYVGRELEDGREVDIRCLVDYAPGSPRYVGIWAGESRVPESFEVLEAVREDTGEETDLTDDEAESVRVKAAESLSETEARRRVREETSRLDAMDGGR